MIKNLLMLRLRGVFGALSSKNKNGEYKKPSALKIVLLIFLYAYLAITFLMLSVMICSSIGALFIPAGESELYFAMISGLSFSLIFVLSIFETKSELFDCKDNELLLSMPIPPGSIVIARISAVLVYNYISEAIIALPASVIYLIISGGELLGFFGSFITALVTPLAATALASAVGYAVALLSKRVKNKTFITMLFSLGFIGAYFAIYTKLFNITDESADIDVAAIAEQLKLIKPIGAASMMSPLPLIIYLAVCIGIAVLAYYIIQKSYLGIVTASHSVKRSKYKAREMKNSGALPALIGKELSLFCSSATYMLNAGIGVVFELAIAILAVFNRDKVMSVVNELCSELGVANDGGAIIASGITAILTVMASTVLISSCSVSLEGKHLWIIRSSPVSSRTVLTAKALAHTVIALPPAIISAAVACIAFGVSPLYTVLSVLVVVAINLLSALFGVVINTAFPKFVFDNEAQPIKQSLSTFIVMMAMMLFGMLVSILAVVSAIFGIALVFMIFAFVVLVGVCIGLYFIMAYPCAKRFDGFSVS